MDSKITDSLTQFNTLGLEADCFRLVRARQEAELIAICLQTFKAQEPLLLIGGGSNIVLTETFQGTAVLVETKGIEVSQDDKHYYLKVEAGEVWHELIQFCLEQNMPGLENLALIPGSVGAAPIQNIGAYGAELAQFCDWVEYLDLPSGEIKRLKGSDCEFAYRESIFKNTLKRRAVILRVGFMLPKVWQPNLSYGPLQELSERKQGVTPKEVFDCICDTRMAKLPDPTVLGNVGSFFKNPVVSQQTFERLQQQYADIVGYPLEDSQVKLAAGWLIDRAGLKGESVGNASIHLKQALVIVNKGGCSGQEVCGLARLVIDRIFDDFGVRLEVEPRIIGATGQKELADA
ncbi:UDP-N-acetylmuramate dehydrogenase [Shewanella sp. Isolate7]|uniref:UDP-N-acetylmuramate dehydrogenase n=1 Tax=Shewanella sp. Isolate7 TaxID=2908528 RepID=UPI001EFD11B1|nr:UDP-N-acetylmuramate dehydrogenase [Shewanella sp. Isolate7]MCG9723542.1 UDP-N-acetylmuramate dehydrogenase [Shewanella sp. Isolate7]